MAVSANNLDSLLQRLTHIKYEPTVAETFFRDILPSKKTCEVREAQISMAMAIEKALAEKKHVMAEAGTGTGKGLAYLVPIVNHIKNHKGRAVISTGTIALQEQLINKDIPFLEEVLDRPLNARLAKGKGNYLCIDRIREEVKNPRILEPSANFSYIVGWAKKTTTGDRAELPWEPGEVWSKICADDSCTGKKCPVYDACFYVKSKALLVGADLIVTNHTLFFIDLIIRTESYGEASVLPGYDIVVFDETHHVEQMARDALGVKIASTRLPSILAQARKLPGAPFIEIAEAKLANDSFFNVLAAAGTVDKFVLPKSEEITSAGDKLISIVSGVIYGFDANLDKKIEVMSDRLSKYKSELGFTLAGKGSEFVHWVENESKGKRKKTTLHATPISVADQLREMLFQNENIESVIMTSATLAAGSSLNYLKRSIGCDESVEVQLDSPFNYGQQCLLYLPAGLPDPKEQDFHVKVAPVVKEVLTATEGRALVLFTSYRGLNEVYEKLAGCLPWTVLRQGDMPKQKLMDKFRDDTHSVLFATASFWEGVSVEGEALSCVVLVKLPFSVPDDPVEQAKIKAYGDAAFFQYSVPQAIIRVKQGFGRLIRTREDRGIVAILDPRVKTKTYGKRFLNALPRCREIAVLDGVGGFLGGGK